MKIRSAKVQAKISDSNEFIKVDNVNKNESDDEHENIVENYGKSVDVAHGSTNFDHAFQIDDEINEEITDGPTFPCPDCGRFFAEGPFQRHARICKKVFASKRKVFDSSKKRAEAIPELKEFRVHGRQRESKPEPSHSERWREQSNAFRMAMRAARAYSTNKDAPINPPVIDSSLKQCPNCLRRFSENAALRHIPICKNIVNKPVTLRKGGGMNASQGLTKKM
jgi:hypothetical protein